MSYVIKYGHLQVSTACRHEPTSPSMYTFGKHSMSAWTDFTQYAHMQGSIPPWTHFTHFAHLQGSMACLHEPTSPSMCTCTVALHACMNRLHPVCTPAGEHCMPAWTDFTQYAHLQGSTACLHEPTSPSMCTCREAPHAAWTDFTQFTLCTPAGKHCMPAWTDFTQYAHLQWNIACLHEPTSPSMDTCREALHACMKWLHPVWTSVGKHCMPDFTQCAHLQGSIACLHELTSPSMHTCREAFLHELTSPSMHTCREALHAGMNWLHPVCTPVGEHWLPFCKQCFLMHLLDKKCLYFDFLNFT